MTTTPVVGTDYVTVASRVPRGTILGVATLHEGVPWGDLVGLIESFNCVGIDVDTVNCSGFKGLTKRFDPPSFSNGVMFNIQGGITCKGPGFDLNDSALRAAFDAQEPEGVSIGIHDAILVNGTDLTPAGGSVTPAQALGLLESAGYLAYAGQPVIHAGPALVSQWAAFQAVRPAGDHLETLLGTPVVASPGNETKTGGKLDADQWAFVTGEVHLWRSEVVQAADIDRTTNDMSALFERLYVAAVDCFTAKVKVKVL
jgi:hypothetical protein